MQIGESQFIYQNLPDEKAEGFYSFKPWWSGRENRTVVLLSDTIFNKVFFYSMWNAYPKHFLTSKHDVNDIIAIFGDDADYHSNGEYYIRLRPDFSLADMISNRQYIYNMFTFSQTPAAFSNEKERAFETLELGNEYLGFVNNSMYQDYRYFQMDMSAVYDIKVTRIPGLG